MTKKPMSNLQRLEVGLRQWLDESHADIDADLRSHIHSGVRQMWPVTARRYGTSSEITHDVLFGDGARFIITQWGGIDGAGVMTDMRVPSHVPAVADVLRAMREHDLSQNEAVVYLGGIE